METNEEQVSRNISATRTRYGYTQESIADKISWTVRTVNNLENNPFAYPINKLNDYAKAIGCNLNEFFLPLQLTNSEK